jgi:hypothetical protein
MMPLRERQEEALCAALSNEPAADGVDSAGDGVMLEAREAESVPASPSHRRHCARQQAAAAPPDHFAEPRALIRSR